MRRTRASFPTWRSRSRSSTRRRRSGPRHPARTEQQEATTMQPEANRMVDLRDVSKRFVKGKETITIFDHLGLAIGRGDFVAVMGPSGSGKTTLLNLLGGIDRADAGEVTVAETRIDGHSEGQLARWRAANI